MGPVDLPGARRKQQKTKWKILAHSGTRTHNPEFWSLMLYRLSKPGLLKAVYLNVLTTTCLHCYKYENNEVECKLSCKCTILCYILEYICVVQIAKRRVSPVFAFNMQIPDQVECLVVSACWKQTQDLCVSLCYLYNIDITLYEGYLESPAHSPIEFYTKIRAKRWIYQCKRQEMGHYGEPALTTPFAQWRHKWRHIYIT